MSSSAESLRNHLTKLKVDPEMLSAQNLEPISMLGSGEYGAVFLFKYEGDDESLLNLCNEQGEVGIKFQKETDENECKIATHLQQQAIKRSKSGAPPPSYNMTAPFEVGGNVIGILTKPEFYDTTFVEGKRVGLASDLNRFFANLTRSDDTLNPAPESTSIREAFTDDFLVMLSQIANSMQKSQAELHQIRIIHCDSALRNFMVNAERDEQGNVISIKGKIADYGLAQAIPEGYNAYKLPKGLHFPLKLINKEILTSNRHASVKTDLYALRVSLISMLGMMTTSNPDLTQETDFAVSHLHMDFTDDRQALEYMLNGVIAGCSDEKKEELSLFLDCYQEYILSMPTTHEMLEAQQYDNNKLIEANNKFVGALFDKIREKNPAELYSNSTLLSLQRLQQIPVNNESLMNVIQDSITIVRDVLEENNQYVKNSLYELQRGYDIDTGNGQKALAKLKELQQIEINDKQVQQLLSDCIDCFDPILLRENMIESALEHMMKKSTKTKNHKKVDAIRAASKTFIEYNETIRQNPHLPPAEIERFQERFQSCISAYRHTNKINLKNRSSTLKVMKKIYHTMTAQKESRINQNLALNEKLIDWTLASMETKEEQVSHPKDSMGTSDERKPLEVSISDARDDKQFSLSAPAYAVTSTTDTPSDSNYTKIPTDPDYGGVMAQQVSETEDDELDVAPAYATVSNKDASNVPHYTKIPTDPSETQDDELDVAPAYATVSTTDAPNDPNYAEIPTDTEHGDVVATQETRSPQEIIETMHSLISKYDYESACMIGNAYVEHGFFEFSDSASPSKEQRKLLIEINSLTNEYDPTTKIENIESTSRLRDGINRSKSPQDKEFTSSIKSKLSKRMQNMIQATKPPPEKTIKQKLEQMKEEIESSKTTTIRSPRH